MTRDEEQGHAGRDDHPLALSRRRGAIGPVSFGSLTLTLFSRGSAREHLASCLSREKQKKTTTTKTYWSQLAGGRMPLWNSVKPLLIHFDLDSYHFRWFDSISRLPQKRLKNRQRATGVALQRGGGGGYGRGGGGW